jgi:hypothetical protein
MPFIPDTIEEKKSSFVPDALAQNSSFIPDKNQDTLKEHKPSELDVFSDIFNALKSDKISLKDKISYTQEKIEGEARKNPLLMAVAPLSPVFTAVSYAASKLPRISEMPGIKDLISSMPTEAEYDATMFSGFGGRITPQTPQTTKTNPQEDMKAVLDFSQNLGEMVIAGKIDSKVSQKIFENTLEQVSSKLTAAGYGTGKVSLDIEKVREAGRGFASGEAIMQNIAARKMEIPALPPDIVKPAAEATATAAKEVVKPAVDINIKPPETVIKPVAPTITPTEITPKASEVSIPKPEEKSSVIKTEEIDSFISSPAIPEIKAEYKINKVDKPLIISKVKEFINRFIKFKDTPIEGKFGHQIYFTPNDIAVSRIGGNQSFIEYALHSLTRKSEGNYNIRMLDKSKVDNIGNIEKIITEADGYYQEGNKINYVKKVNESKSPYAIIVLEKTPQGLKFTEDSLRYVTHLPGRKLIKIPIKNTTQVTPPSLGSGQGGSGVGGEPSALVNKNITQKKVNVNKEKTSTSFVPDKEQAKPTVSEKYYISQVGKGFVEVKGKPVEIMKGVDTFIHKEVGGNNWVISEAKSGLSLGVRAKTQKEAVDQAKNFLKEKKITDFTPYIEKAVKSSGLSPRYEQPKTQKEKIEESVSKESKSIKQIAEETKILEPNVRRILGVGTKDGTFSRVEKGVYVLNKNGKDIAYIHTGNAIDVLPKLAREGFKADMIFLDIPYKTPAVIGGNRGIKYDYITPEEFRKVVIPVSLIARTEDTPIIYMYSQARSGLKEMQKYTDILLEAGFKPLAKGEYTKYQKDGVTRVRNMRGDVIEPEGILLLNYSGKFNLEGVDLNFKLVRPKGYQTEKPAEMLKKLITMTTKEGEVVLDPFAGSGVTIEQAVKTGRVGVGIEKNPEVVEKFIKPKIGEVIKEKLSTPSGTAFASIYHNDIPIEQGKEYYKLKSFETPELIRLVREVLGKYPEVVRKTGKAAGRFIAKGKDKNIKLVAELFEQGNEKELGIVIAHEFGHLTDWLPDETLKRGNLLGRILSLRGFLKQTFGELNNKEIKEELVAVTKYMHPFDEVHSPDSYVKYRMSSRELYAEAISLLLNSPGTMEKLAPKFTKAFFENIDKKLEVKEAYFDLLELLNGERTDVLDALDEDIRRMFAKADPLRKQKLAEKKVATMSTFDKIRQHLDNKYHPLLKKIQELEKQGKFIPMEDNPKYLLEEYAMSNNAVYNWLLDMDKEIKNPLVEADIDLIDFGKYMFLKRIIGSPKDIGDEFAGFDDEDKDSLGEMIDASTGKPYKEEFTDRQDIANPLGIQPKRAQEQLDFMKGKIGDTKFAKIEEVAKKFHELVFGVVEQAVKVGSYNPKVFEEKILPNKDTYVSFGVINYMQNFVSAGVKKQIGTLSEIENPFITTIMKTISLIKLNEKQITNKAIRDFLKNNFPDEIALSRKHKTTGGGVDWNETPGSFKILEEGRMVSYEIDPYIAMTLKYDPHAGEIGKLLNTILGNKIFKDIVITYNPGFAFAFNPIRDFKRTYKALAALDKNVSILRLLKEFVKNMPLSYRRLRGIDDSLIREMTENRALDIPFNDFFAGDYNDGNASYNELLKRYNLSKNPEELKGIRRKILKPVVQVLEFLRFHGSALESLSKIAGYNILKSKDVPPMERAFYTRNYIGTPNFRTHGLSTETTNAIFIFSNIMKEGLKADIGLATNPKTRSGYWWSTAKVDLFPKLLMVLAGAGLFGVGLKKFIDKVSEYDKTNYIIIPLGESKGKAVYARLPHDETGRLMSAMFWKVANVFQGKPEQLTQIFAFGAGQMPQLTPALSAGTGWLQYLSGNNPYEPFRGGNVLTDTEYKAGGGLALKKMVTWSLGEFGASQFFTYNKDTNSTFETALQLTPIANRLIKASDSGVYQELRQERRKIEQEQARIVITKRKEFKQGADRLSKGEDFMSVLKDIKKKVYGNEIISNQKATALLKGLAKEYIKEKEDSPYIDALVYAASNDEKKQILKKMRASMSLEEFKKKANLLYKFRIITDNTMPMSEWDKLLQ